VVGVGVGIDTRPQIDGRAGGGAHTRLQGALDVAQGLRVEVELFLVLGAEPAAQGVGFVEHEVERGLFLREPSLHFGARHRVGGAAGEDARVGGIRIGFGGHGILRSHRAGVRMQVPDVVLLAADPVDEVAVGEARVLREHTVADRVVGARTENVADGRRGPADRVRALSRWPRRERAAALLVVVGHAVGRQLAEQLVQAVQDQELAAVGLERREKLAELECLLAGCGEALTDLVAVGLENEDDAPRSGRALRPPPTMPVMASSRGRPERDAARPSKNCAPRQWLHGVTSAPGR